MCKHATQKFPYLLRYVPDQDKAQQISDKSILENGGTLNSVTECYKNQEMCNKAVENYPHALEFVHVLNDIRLKTCVIKLLILILLQ